MFNKFEVMRYADKWIIWYDLKTGKGSAVVDERGLMSIINDIVYKGKVFETE